MPPAPVPSGIWTASVQLQMHCHSPSLAPRGDPVGYGFQLPLWELSGFGHPLFWSSSPRLCHLPCRPPHWKESIVISCSFILAVISFSLWAYYVNSVTSGGRLWHTQVCPAEATAWGSCTALPSCICLEERASLSNLHRRASLASEGPWWGTLEFPWENLRLREHLRLTGTYHQTRWQWDLGLGAFSAFCPSNLAKPGFFRTTITASVWQHNNKWEQTVFSKVGGSFVCFSRTWTCHSLFSKWNLFLYSL